MKKNKAINSDAYAFAERMLGVQNSILNAEVWGKWLKLTLASGTKFYIKNISHD